MPPGTVAVRASNRDLPGTERLSREQRKLAALADLRVRPVETVETLNKLYFWRPGRWSRVNLGWDPACGTFMGWYVNFEQPVAAAPTGIWGKDLVLDLLIAPDGSSTPKDEGDFEQAIAQGIVPDQLRALFAAEIAIVREEVDAGTGPFATSWQHFRPDPAWAEPKLPTSHTQDGTFWNLLHAPPVAGGEWTIPIVTERTLVRPVGVADAGALAALAADSQVRAFLGGPRPMTVAHERAVERATAEREDDLVLEDRISTDVIGHMAEALNSLFKAECIRNPVLRGNGWRSIDDVELAVATYVDWYNHRRLHGEIGYVIHLESHRGIDHRQSPTRTRNPPPDQITDGELARTAACNRAPRQSPLHDEHPTLNCAARQSWK